MTRLCVIAPIAFLAIHATNVSGFAATISYSDRISFNNAAGHLVTEDFESANLSGAVVNVDSPINDQTDNGVFSPGDIQSGLSVDYVSALAVVNADYVTGTSKMVRDQAEGSATDRQLVLAFDSPITSLGFDIFAAFEPGPSQPIDGGISIERRPLPDERFEFSLAEISGAFVGLVSDEPFSFVRMNLGGRIPAFIDNISFSAPIPTPAASTLLTLASVGLGLGRRR